MSNNLNNTALAQNQSSPEVTINNSIGRIDAALTENFTCALAAGNVLVSATQYRETVRLLASGVVGAGRTVTLQAIKKFVIFQAAAANTHSISVILGSTTLTFTPDEKALLYTDGTANGLTKFPLSSGGVSAFTGLSDVPASYSGQALKQVRVNAGATGLEFFTASAGVTNFTDLADVPASYATHGLQAVRVNTGATGLEFYTPAGGGGSGSGVSVLATLLSPTSNIFSFDGIDFTAYAMIELLFETLTLNTDDGWLSMTFDVAGVEDTAQYQYQVTAHENNGTATGSNGSASSEARIKLTIDTANNGIGTGTGEACDGQIRIYNPIGASKYKQGKTFFEWGGGLSTRYFHSEGSLRFTRAAAIDGMTIRGHVNGGVVANNITAGKATLIGYARA